MRNWLKPFEKERKKKSKNKKKSGDWRNWKRTRVKPKVSSICICVRLLNHWCFYVKFVGSVCTRIFVVFSLWLFDLIFFFFSWIRKKKCFFVRSCAFFIIIIIDVYFGCWLLLPSYLSYLSACLLACLSLSRSHSSFFLSSVQYICLIACSFTLLPLSKPSYSEHLNMYVYDVWFST